MSTGPVIEGIVETILYADDLPRAVAFYRDVLGLRPMGGDGRRLQSFNAGGRQALLIFQRGTTLEPLALPGGGVIPAHDSRGPHHLGLAITHDAYDPWVERLRAAGVEIESEVTWERGSRSVYFRDSEGNALELVTPGLWPNY